VRPYAVAVLLAVVPSLCMAGRDEISLGPVGQYSDGPTSFPLQSIAFRGRPLGYASAYFAPEKFSRRYWVFLECRLDPNEEGMASCGQWKRLDIKSGRVVDLVLPGFREFFSGPAFAWPYVAYVAVPQLNGEESNTDVYCTVLNYSTGRIVRKVRQHIPDDFRSTDFGHMFFAPEISRHASRKVFTYKFDGDGGVRKICELSVP